MIVGVWPHNNSRGEIVAMKYGNTYLVFQRYGKTFHAWQCYKDPNEIHGHYTKGRFRENNTYISPAYVKDRKTGVYASRDMSHQGRDLGWHTLDDECDWYNMMSDPQPYMTVALL